MGDVSCLMDRMDGRDCLTQRSQRTQRAMLVGTDWISSDPSYISHRTSHIQADVFEPGRPHRRPRIALMCTDRTPHAKVAEDEPL